MGNKELCNTAAKAINLAETYGEELQDQLKLFSQLTKVQKPDQAESMREEIHMKLDVLLDQIQALGVIFKQLKEAEQ